MNTEIELKPASGRMAVADIIAHVAVVQEVMRAVMKKDVHYGVIPGTDKPTLYKAGAEVLCMVFRIADSYEVTDMSAPDTVRYRVNCIGTNQVSGAVLGAGLGEASSGEEKYKWRKAVCTDEFNGTPENMRRVKHARGKGGTTYKVEQIRTEPADLANTILKMANKRAKMAMTLNVTAASDCFSQDLEDMDAALVDHLTRHEGDAPSQPAKPTAPAYYSKEDFSKNLLAWQKVIASGRKTAEDIISMAQTKHPLTEDQKAAVRASPVVEDAKPAVVAQAPADVSAVPYAFVADALYKATNMDELDQAADLIGQVADAAQRRELAETYDARRVELI